MELILTRIAKKKNYTIGKLYIRTEITEDVERKASPRRDWERGYFCDTLEPTWRDYKHGGYKVKGRSAIPEGRYAVVISWSPKMKQWLPILLGVPNFSGIRIHAGNTADDTQGCILVGKNTKVGAVLESTTTFKALYEKLKSAKDDIYITIK